MDSISTDTTRALPTGTVTFLFTDIEGSTALLLRLRDGYADVLARHSKILRRAIETHGGVVVGTEGDSFFAAFDSALDAASAIVEAQRDLLREAWPADGVVRVRMGLHTGKGRLSGSDYVGIDVNRAARIAAAAHGGQTVVSDATKALIDPAKSAGFVLHDLGEHRLKDIPAPEHLWQMDIDGRSTSYPELRTQSVRLGNVPAATTELFGRVDAVAEICRVLETRRLVTLTGPGGTGKTSLALAAARELLPNYADGAFFVGLEEARDGADLASGIAAAIGVRERPGGDAAASVRDFITERRLLLVLDNLEQVPEAGPYVSELLKQAAHLRVLATSRSALGVAGEREYLVPPLPVPDPEALPSLAELSLIPSVTLFVERARDVSSDFSLTADNAASIALICARLDGLPLALELAAGRMRLLTPQAMLARLERALPALGTGSKAAPKRQRTLRAAIDWSYQLLDPSEQRLLARLAVFAGGWSLDDAERICVVDGQELTIDVFEGHASLAEKSLIRRVESEGGAARFSMLQLVREYAADALAATDEGETLRQQHAIRFAKLAEKAEPQLIRTELRAWQHRLRADGENLRFALRWLRETGDFERFGRMAGALRLYWQYWGAIREGREWLEAAVASVPAGAPVEARAVALTGLAWLLYWQGEVDRADALYDEVVEIRRGLGDDLGTAVALADSVWTGLARDEPALSISRAEEALLLFRRADGEVAEAEAEVWEPTVAYVIATDDSPEAALATAREAGRVNQQYGKILYAAEWQTFVARGERLGGRYEESGVILREALDAFVAMGNIGRLPSLFEEFAALEIAQGRPVQAVRLAAASARYTDELGVQPSESVVRAGDPIAEARAVLDPATFEQAVESGRAMTVEQVVALALEQE
jgi:predicted ATPase/class 3 adenylate cyclase